MSTTKITVIAAVALILPIVLVAAAAGGIAALFSGTSSGDCTPAGPTTTYASNYGPDQMANAATIVAVGKQMTVPERGWVIAIAAAMQESALRNLDHGDRDSLGLFQQRPSQGWGTPAQIMNPTYAATQFYQHLLAVSGWRQMTVTDAAQAVQRSGFPNAYAQHEKTAMDIVAAVHATTCTTTPGPVRTDWPPEQATVPDPTSNGHITPRTHTLLAALQKRGMTGDGIGCFAHRPHNPTSDHPNGRACDIMLNPHDQKAVAGGWTIAHWLTTNQAHYGINYLIWQGQYWSAHYPRWVTYQSDAYSCPNPAHLTGCHYDHIHISVY